MNETEVLNNRDLIFRPYSRIYPGCIGRRCDALLPTRQKSFMFQVPALVRRICIVVSPLVALMKIR
ncbi:hypothetical protein CS542_09360 [Pedobacter sp. IW39]|nr:hypothetical protein CS542_09360 [Pedobacter sp. IW39]